MKHPATHGMDTPRREFLYNDDMADACPYLLEQPESKLASLFNNEQPPLVSIGCEEDLSIRELAELVAEVVSFKGIITFDTSKPDGTMRKVIDVSKLRKLGWEPNIELNTRVAMAYEEYLDRNNQ